MSWTWVRPRDRSVLAGRPLLDLGTGDGQTVDALVDRGGLVVGVDRTAALLSAGSINAEGDHLPFAAGAFATVLAADLFHHLDDRQLRAVLGEVRRVLAPGGRLVAWWYEETTDRSPDAPRFCRSLAAVTEAAQLCGLDARRLDVVTAVAASPTVGVLAVR